MRLSVERLPNGVDLINDAYNANPGSMRAALAALEGVAKHCVVVLGEMRELGPGAAALHAEVGAAVARLGPRSFCAVGPYAADYARGAVGAGMAGGAVTAVATNAAAADVVASSWRPGDAVLVKGSRGAAWKKWLVGAEEASERVIYLLLSPLAEQIPILNVLRYITFRGVDGGDARSRSSPSLSGRAAPAPARRTIRTAGQPVRAGGRTRPRTARRPWAAC